MDDHPAELHRVLRTAKRRFLLPPLPSSLQAAADAGEDVLLAFCLESARLAVARDGVPSASVEQAFSDALAQLIRRAMDATHGDPTFQAQVLHWRDAGIQEWAALSATAAGDARELRTALDAFAHPGKLRGLPEDALRGALLQLHDLAHAADWAALRAAAETVAEAPAGRDPALSAWVRALVAHPALNRRLRALELDRLEAVRHYKALRFMRSPAVGSSAAVENGRTSAREGTRTEQAAAHALQDMADCLNAAVPGGAAPYRVLRSLLTPAALAGTDRSKLEWDAAIVRSDGAESGIDDVVLLAEAKAAPAAATTDLPRLLRGLAGLSQAREGSHHDFACAGGAVRLSGASLRALQPQGHAIPAQVIYLCAARPEPRPALLGAAARALLLAESASLGFAAELAQGRAPAIGMLAPVWHALLKEGRLRAVLNQYDTARRAREAMLHPDDLSAAVQDLRRERA